MYFEILGEITHIETIAPAATQIPPVVATSNSPIPEQT
jgi:hypothetical protein